MDKYKAFLFDWDGTIARTLEAWLQIMRECFDVFGLDQLTDSEIASTLGNMEEKTLELGLSKKDFPEFELLVKEKAVERIPLAEFYDGIEHLLETLQNSGKKTGIVTANLRAVIDRILKTKGLHDDFDIVVTGDEVAHRKPDPEGILRAIEKFNVKKHETLMLGDSVHDIEAALNAGIDSVLYYPASHELFHDFEKLKALGPTFIIDDWSRLLKT